MILKIFVTVTALAAFSCAGLPTAPEEPYQKAFKDADFLFHWRYDLQEGEDVILVRGNARNIATNEFESISITVTGLDHEGGRRDTGHARLRDLDVDESDEFSIRVPKSGKEKSVLFTYEYEFYIISDSTGPNYMMGWFEDPLDPNEPPREIKWYPKKSAEPRPAKQ